MKLAHDGNEQGLIWRTFTNRGIQNWQMTKLANNLLEAQITTGVGQIRFDYKDAGTPRDGMGSPSSPDSWQHLCYTWQQHGGQGITEFYVNGGKSTSSTGDEQITQYSWQGIGTLMELGPLVTAWQNPRLYSGFKLRADQVADLYKYDVLNCRDYGVVVECPPPLTTNAVVLSVMSRFPRWNFDGNREGTTLTFGCGRGFVRSAGYYMMTCELDGNLTHLLSHLPRTSFAMYIPRRTSRTHLLQYLRSASPV